MSVKQDTPHEIASGDFADLLKGEANKKDNVEEDDDESEEFFKVTKPQEKDIESVNAIDSTKAYLDTSNLDKWDEEEVSICFSIYQLYLATSLLLISRICCFSDIGVY